MREQDLVATVRCVAAFLPHDNVVADDPSDWQTAAEVLIAAVHIFPKHLLLVATALAALHRTGEWSDHIDDVIVAARGGDAKVVKCAARVLHAHVLSARGLEKLPTVATVAAGWMELYPLDHDIEYYGAVVLVTAASVEPVDITRVHGQTGVDAVDVAVVRGATATQLDGVLTIEDRKWSEWVMEKLFPRLRGAARARAA